MHPRSDAARLTHVNRGALGRSSNFGAPPGRCGSGLVWPPAAEAGAKPQKPAVGTAQRDISSATVVAAQAVNDPGTISMVVVSSLIGLAILFPVARVLYRGEARRRSAAAAEVP